MVSLFQELITIFRVGQKDRKLIIKFYILSCSYNNTRCIQIYTVEPVFRFIYFFIIIIILKSTVFFLLTSKILTLFYFLPENPRS